MACLAACRPIAPRHSYQTKRIRQREAEKPSPVLFFPASVDDPSGERAEAGERQTDVKLSNQRDQLLCQMIPRKLFVHAPFTFFSPAKTLFFNDVEDLATFVGNDDSRGIKDVSRLLPTSLTHLILLWRNDPHDINTYIMQATDEQQVKRASERGGNRTIPYKVTSYSHLLEYN